MTRGLGESSKEWSIAVCGLNCAKCDIYSASHGNEKIKPEHVRCEGCRGSLDTHWSSECKMMLCARKRGFQYCFQCEDFPCTSVNEFSSDGISHHKRTIENSKRMKEIGIEAWIKEQKRKGQCVFCP